MLDLSIIIVNYNTRDLLKKCLETVYQHTSELSFEVIVVDNASQDASAAMVSQDFPAVRLIRSEENLGFGGGNNRAIPLAGGRNVLFLNSDTELIEPIFHKMVAYLDEHPQLGAVAPRLLLPDGSNQGGDGGWRPSLGRMFIFALLLNQIFPALRAPWLTKGDYLQDSLAVDWLSGACLMLNQAALAAVGGFDTSFFMYAEDIELSNNIQAKGWGLCLLPQLSIIHRAGSSSKKKGASSQLGIQGLDVYYRSHYSKPYTASLHALAALGFFLRSLILRGQALLKKDAALQDRADTIYYSSLASWQYMLRNLGQSDKNA